MIDIRSESVELDGLGVHFYTAGEAGSPVVLLHGGGTDSAMLSWKEAIPALALEHRVFAPDWPGYGQSEMFRSGDYSFAEMTAWLSKLLDYWKLERVSLVGISMGGGGALDYVLSNPQQVDRLVLADSYGLARFGPSHHLSYFLVRMPWMMDWSMAWVRKSRKMTRWSLGSIFADPRHITDELVEDVFQAAQNPSAERAFSVFQKAELKWRELKTCYMDRLSEIQAPTLIVHGDHDSLVPIAAAREAAHRISGARLEVIANAGHWPMREQPEVFNRIVREFLA